MSRTKSRRSSRVQRLSASQLSSRVQDHLPNQLRKVGPRTPPGTRRSRRSRLIGLVSPTWRTRSTRSKIAGAGIALVLGAAAVALTRRATHRLATRNVDRDQEKRGLDTLTGLPNRAEAVWWLNLRLQRARSRSHRLAVMVLDLNDFAGCNDLHGRAAGDHVLQVTATRMQAQLRTGDIICRTGSDTFLVIMDAVGPDHLVSKVGERIVEAVAEPISFHGDSIQVTSSLGFALSKDHETSYELLLDRADRALIQAKAAGRSIVQF